MTQNRILLNMYLFLFFFKRLRPIWLKPLKSRAISPLENHLSVPLSAVTLVSVFFDDWR